MLTINHGTYSSDDRERVTEQVHAAGDKFGPLLTRLFCMRTGYCLSFCLVTVVLISCTSQRAVIDRSAMEKILWPGPPEKPRISYLWNVSLLSGSEGSRAASFLAGEDDATDPRTSERLLRPYSIFVDEQGVLYITDPGAYRITIIDLKSNDARNILDAGTQEFLSPIGIVAFQGKVYVSDSLLNKVFIFDAEGRLVGELQGEFKRPTSLALDRARGRIYVTDTLAHVIYQYDPEGRRLNALGRNGSEAGEFNFPTHIWIDRAGKLYVTDAMNFRIQIFSPAGVYEGSIGMLGDAYGDLEKPKGVAVDSDGNVYVVDAIKDMVKIFSREGKLLLFFGQQGRDFGQFWLPSGIFIDEKDQIYVADTYNSRVQVFRYLGNK